METPDTYARNATTNGELDTMMEKVTESRYIGPGSWAILHLTAIEADEDEGNLEHFLFLINLLANRFKANECREHFVKYASDHSVQRGKAFEWSVGAHNDVNRRQGKMIVSVKEARKIWEPENVRIAPCSEEKTPTHSTNPTYIRQGQQPSYAAQPPVCLGTYCGPLSTMNSLQTLFGSYRM